MSDAPSNNQPPVAWRYSGDQMKRWRTRADVSREKLASAANYSPDTIASWSAVYGGRRRACSTWRTNCAARRGC
ncbi:helix-turn-helix domain-containing protein [Streptomyces phyllanthi]|uniref:helix-turn-helix domain-containing protein n=1 Tax=Streptomyces phyllanthi TaxID=1803180 RepID=UPI002AD3DAE9|nr:helix-turn-helix transcriptional regulator [Streptomyces phyllanthi]